MSQHGPPPPRAGPADAQPKAPPKWGEKYNGLLPEKDGALDLESGRSCTDCFCCLLFLVAMLAFVGVTLYAVFWMNADPRVIVYPLAWDGKFCGLDYPSSPDLFIPWAFDMVPDITHPNTSFGWCVSACPRTPDGSFPYTLCYNESTPRDASYYLTHSYPECQLVWSNSTAVLGRCAPLNDTGLGAVLNNTLVQALVGTYTSIVQRSVSDLTNTTVLITLGCCAVGALLLCFLWLLMVQACATCMVWMSIIMVLLVMTAASAYVLYKGYMAYTFGQSEVARGITNYDFTNSYIILGIGSALALVTLILLFLVCGFCSRINLACRIIMEATGAIRSMMSLIIAPTWSFILMILATALWILACAYLVSTTTVVDGGHRTFDFSNKATYIAIFAIFAIFWALWWIGGMTQVTIAGSIASWYFTHPDANDHRKNPDKSPVFHSFSRAWRKHMGSVAFGSLIIAIISTIRAIIAYFQAKLKKSTNKVAQYTLACLQCFFTCFQKIMQFISKNAYIMVAIHGDSFCRGAKSAFNLLMRNILRMAVVNSIGDFLTIMGRLFISIVTSAVLTIIIRPDFISSSFSTLMVLNYWWLPVVLCFIVSFLIASAFMSVYGMAIDTMFLCFCEDEERYSTTAGYRPYASKGLRDFMKESEERGRAEQEIVEAKFRAAGVQHASSTLEMQPIPPATSGKAQVM